MKKMIATMLALTLALSFAACSGQETQAKETKETKATQAALQDTEATQEATKETTQEATQETVPVQSAQPTQTQPTQTQPTQPQPAQTQPTQTQQTKPTQATQQTTQTPQAQPEQPQPPAAHTHSYSAQVTTAATCLTDGVNTYRCSCGASYTEPVKAPGQHTLGDWQVYQAGTGFTPQENRKTCTSCDYFEISMNYDRLVANFAAFAQEIETFSSVQGLQGDLDQVITAALRCGADCTRESGTDGYYYTILPVASLDAFTASYLGTTYDYTGVQNTWVLCESLANYDPERNAVIIRSAGIGGDDMPQVTVDHQVINADQIHIHLTYTYSWGHVWQGVMTIQKAGNSYIATSFVAN